MTRLAIMADHPCVVQTIRAAVERNCGCRFVGWADGRQDVRAALATLRPDVVLVDDMSDRALTLARLREIQGDAPGAACVLLTRNMDEPAVDEALQAGAHALISKAVPAVAIGTLLREIVRGTVVHRPPRRARATAAGSPLTAREAEILGLVSRGMTNARIARELWLTEQTVKFHLSNTYRKLGVSNRTEATHYAHVHGIVEPPARAGTDAGTQPAVAVAA